MNLPNFPTMTRRRFLGAAALFSAAALWPLRGAAWRFFQDGDGLPSKIRARTRPLDMANVHRPGPWAG